MKKKLAFTMAEVLIAMAIAALLSGSLYQMMSFMRKSYSYTQDKLEILQSVRLIMAHLRHELREADKRPEVYPSFAEDVIHITMPDNRTIIYYYDKEENILYKGEKEKEDAPDPRKDQLKKFIFKDGQIIDFDYDSSYSKESFIQSELGLNSKLWFKIQMKILYTTNFDKLTPEELSNIKANMDNDPRVKTFSMTINPRKPNWILQSSQ